MLIAFVYESDNIGELARWLAPDTEWLQRPLVYTVIALVGLPTDLGLAYYSGFVLERRHELSTQTARQFWTSYMKDVAFNGSIVLASTAILFLSLEDPNLWWLYNAAGMTIMLLLLIMVAPIYFRKRHEATPLDDPILVGRLQAMAERFGINISRVMVYRISKESKKANAYLAGLGNTKVIFLADTLIATLTTDEIVAVLAHELGHSKLLHQLRLLVVAPLAMLASFYGCHQVLLHLATVMGYSSIVAPEALPLMWLVMTFTNALAGPVMFYFVRRYEDEADLFALEHTKNPDAFIGAFHKLAKMNKTPESLPWWRELLMCDHPTIKHRIEAVNAWKEKQTLSLSY
jgi:STE24 endopeptidase